MTTFKEYQPRNEKELHQLIEKELESLEEGMVLIQHEMDLGGAVPDFLCVDSGSRLAVIEAKLLEDENILYQGLRYYDKVDINRYAIATFCRNLGINTQEDPRIILIAKKFSDNLRRLCTHVKPTIELYEYTAIEYEEGIKGIVFNPISLPIKESMSEPKTIEDHEKYLTKLELKPVLERVRDEIKEIGEGVEEYSTQDYIGYKYNKRQFAYIITRRKFFDLGTHKIDENRKLLDYLSIKIENGNEDYQEIFGIIKKSFKYLGGKIKENLIRDE